MARQGRPDYSLFVDILLTLEQIDAPYMIIGAFAANMYGSSRLTYDIDIVVNLTSRHIDALVEAYPLPRYYADPQQMRDSIRMGIMFNIIDTSRGEKADLVPLTMEPRYRFAFERRVRRRVELTTTPPFDVWCARAEDVIVGKLMAWQEGRSDKHRGDIYEMLVIGGLEDETPPLDELYIDQQARRLGDDVWEFWQSLRTAAHNEIARYRRSK